MIGKIYGNWDKRWEHLWKSGVFEGCDSCWSKIMNWAALNDGFGWILTEHGWRCWCRRQTKWAVRTRTFLEAKPWDLTSFTAKVLGMGWSKEAFAADVSEERLAAGHTSSALLQTVSHQLPALRFSPSGASGHGPRGNEALQIFKHPRCLCRIVSQHGYEWNTRIIMK